MTLENDFNTLISEMEDNLQAMGVLDAEYDSSTGLRGLSARILDIEPSVSGLNLETSLTVQSETEIEVGESVLISSKLNVFYDDETLVNVDLTGVLTGATINIKEGNNIVGTGITNSNGIADISVSNLSLGTHNLKAVFTGTENFQECESNTISIDVVTLKPTNIEINATKNILSYTDTDSTDITVTVLNKSDVPVSGKTVTMGIYMEDDDSLLETLTVVDENDGTYTSTYSSRGVGDIYVKAECGSLVTEIFALQDCIYYHDMTSADSTHWTIPSSANATYSSNGMKLTGSSWSDCYLEIPLTKPYSVEFDLMQWTGSTTYMHYFYDSTKSTRLLNMYKTEAGNTALDEYPKTDNRYYGGIPEGSHVKIEINNDNAKLYVSDELKLTKSYTMPSTSIFGVTGATNRTTTWKNIKIKPL